MDKDPTRNSFGLPKTPQLDLGKMAAEALENMIQALLDSIWELIEGAAKVLINGTAEALHQLVQFVQGLLNGDWPDLPASNLIGLLPARLFGSVPASAITDDNSNLALNPDFTSSLAIAPASDWSVDNTVYRTEAGSARVAADGRPHGLRSNTAMVASKQKVALQIHVLTTDLACTGEPIVLELLNAADGSVLASDATGEPIGFAPNWDSAPDGSRSGVLECDWTAPDGVGQVEIRARIAVGEGATGGVVHFDDCVWDIVKGPWSRLLSDQQSIWDAVTDFITALWNAVTNYTDWETFSTAVNDAWHALATIFYDVNRDQVANFEDLLGTLIPGLFDESGVPHGLLKLWDNWNARVGAWNTFAQAAWQILSDLISGEKSWSQTASAFQSVWDTFAAAIAGITAQGDVTLQKLLNKVFHLDGDGTIDISWLGGLLPKTQVDGLQDDLNDITDAESAKSQNFADLLNDWWDDLTHNGREENQSPDKQWSWMQLFTHLDQHWKDYVTANDKINTDEWASLSQIINGLLGINIDPDSDSYGQMGQSMVDGLTDTWTQIDAGMHGNTDDAGGWAWLGELVNGWNDLWTSTQNDAVAANNKLAKRNNAPTYEGLDESTLANMALSQISADAVEVGSGKDSRIAFVRAKQTDEDAGDVLQARGAVGFVCRAEKRPDHFYVSLFKMDPDTRELKLHASSSDIAHLIPLGSNKDDIDWVQYNFRDDGNQIPLTEGDLVAVEYQSVGEITYVAGRGVDPSLGGLGAGKIPTHPTKRMRNFAANPTSSSHPAPPTGNLAEDTGYAFHGDHIPYVALEIEGPTTGGGEPPTDPVHHPDRFIPYTRSSSGSVPSWVRKIYAAGLGAGGGGQGELGYSVGHGGGAGSWSDGSITLTEGHDYTMAVTVGQGGEGGPYFSYGDPGGVTTVTVRDTTDDVTHTLVNAAGGAAGGSSGGGAFQWGNGVSPRTKSFQGRTLTGGASQLSATVGNPPGGGGAGAGVFQFGFKGARGAAWVLETE